MVQGNGNLLIGKAYRASGTAARYEYEIKLGRKQIRLILWVALKKGLISCSAETTLSPWFP